LRVVRVSEYVTPSAGGKEVHVYELSRRQEQFGHSVQLLYRVGGEQDWPFASMSLLSSGTWRRLPHTLVSTAFLTAALMRIARKPRDVDLVHFHGDYLEALAAGAVRLLRIPSVITVHGRLSPRVLRMIGFVYRLPSHIIAVSSGIASQLEGRGRKRDALTIQPSGVDQELFYAARRPPVRPPFRVLVASALIPLKDHATVLIAVRLLQDEGLDIRLEIAGIGPERRRLEDLAPRHTRFHGQLERSALGQLMRRCHAAALASVDTSVAGEGTPTALMEGIACGLPFVATDVGGVPQLALQSRAGAVVPEGNPAAFAVELRKLATDHELYAARRRAAISFAPRLDWDVVAERLDVLISSIVFQHAGTTS
jgi:glycosyltransferase involved in cell wall biosynthesis